MKDKQSTYRGDEIAVIGLSVLFSEVDTIDGFWQALKEGKELIHFYSEEELKAMGLDDQMIQADNYVRIGSQLPHKDGFDAEFFKYLPNEARVMDPQIRLFHECAWKALEDAGVDTDHPNHRIGLFAGASSNLLWKGMTQFASAEQGVSSYALGQLNDKDFLTTLVSYKLNLKGPSIAVNTACSTSLVAVHLAVRNLLLGECDIALAGGISISSNPIPGYRYQPGMINSADGHCKPFDVDSDGTVPGEGAGVVVLKKLKQAIEDHDHIYAIIKGSAINNDGQRKLGYTAPSIDGQVDCIRTAHKIARVPANSIAYIEAHGTATQLGDPIEIEALNRVFGKSDQPYCGIGSLKSNVGHLDVAAGVAGFIKACLVLKNRTIPPSLHFSRPNPSIDFEGSALSVTHQLTPIGHEISHPLRAGVSSFGIGGTNAHVVLEEAPAVQSSNDQKFPKVLTLSAKTTTSLLAYVKKLRQFVLDHPELNLADLCYTLQMGRKDFDCRYSLCFTNRESLLEQLANFEEQDSHYLGASPKTVFLFPGQGTQYFQMGKALYDTEPYFAQLMDEGFAILQSIHSADLKALLFEAEEEHQKIHQTEYTQPLLFLVEYAMARLAMHHGLQPDFMIGHSLGEYIAATISGVFSFEAALKLIVIRSQLMSEAPEGAMLSIVITEQELLPLLPDAISLSAVNTDHQCVVGGSHEAIDDFSKILEEQDIHFVRLKVSHAFHSPSMDSLLESFEAAFEGIELKDPQIPFVSNLSGAIIENSTARSAKYWAKHLRQPVLFKKGIDHLMDVPDLVFVELGPRNALSNFIRQSYPEAICFNSLGKSKASGEEHSSVYQTFGRLWMHGLPINWATFYTQQDRKKISLPTYAFEPTTYPLRVDFKQLAGLQNPPAHPPRSLDQWFYLPGWKQAYLSEATSQDTGVTLLFSDHDEVQRAFETEFKNRDATLVIITPSNHFEKYSTNHWTVNPSDPESYQQLFEALTEEQWLPQQMIYAWRLRQDKTTLVDGRTVYNEQSDFHYLLRLCQAIEANLEEATLRLVFLSQNYQSAWGKEQGRSELAAATGFLKVFSMEHPTVSCTHFDYAASSSPAIPVSAIYRELMSSSTNFEVALHRNRRWVRQYEAIPVNPSDHSLRTGATYLITGGTGKLGLCLGTHLVQKYQAQLILIGKTALPPKAHWEQSNGISESQQQKIQQIKNLQELGGKVHYYSSDLSDPQALVALLEKIEQQHGVIHGVIHAAGNMDNALFQPVSSIELATATQQLVPKVDGTIGLCQFFAQRSLDFFWCTSSLSTVLGGYTYGSYVAANQFMEHYFLSYADSRPHWKSIALDNLELDRSSGEASIGAAELIEIFERSLRLPQLQQLIISTSSLADRQAKYAQPVATAPPQVQNVQRRRRQLRTPYVAAGTDLEIQLVTLWQDFFEMDKIGIDDDFFELGGDSLKALMLLKLIHKQMDVEVSMKDFFDQATIRGVGMKIENALWVDNEVSGKNKMVF